MHQLKIILKVFSPVVFLLLFAQASFAQLVVVNASLLNMTPLQLVQRQLVGQGVTVSNATFNGSSAVMTSNQLGLFTAVGGAYGQLGLGGGIIMTSGEAHIAVGPNNQGGAGAGLGLPGDPDLTAIADTATHDAAVLEFDFVPTADTLRFRYVFGSEEFMEYCNSPYNDAFGFFISGPGLLGPFSNNSVNIARMPNGFDYVTIHNLCNNPMYLWQNAGGVYFQYDALSLVFTAWCIVQPCSTYHIKLAVADAWDYVFDSGVFLEKNSFSATSFTVTNTYQYPSIGLKSVEGCSSATVSFNLAQASTYIDTLFYTITGTATNGVDFPTIPDYVVYQIGDDSAGIVISPYMDLIPEGTEYVVLNIPMWSCSGTVTYHDTIFILDNTAASVAVGNDTTICEGQSITLHATPSGGQYPYSYLWNSVLIGQDQLITPAAGVSTWWVQMNDGCDQIAYDTLIVTTTPAPHVTNVNTVSSICSGSNTNIVPISSIPGSTFIWTATCANPNISGYSAGSGLTIVQTLTNTGTITDTVVYHVQAIAAGCTGPVKNFKVAVIAVADAYFQPINGEMLCNGGTSNIKVLSHLPGTTFTWTYSYSSANLSGASNGSGVWIINTLFNSGSTVDTVTYHVIPWNTGCPGPVYKVKVIVNPVPHVNATPPGQGICTGAATSLALSSNVAGANFTWTASCPSPNVSGYGPGSGNTIAQILTNIGTTTETVTYIVTPFINGCQGISQSFLVTVSPVPNLIINSLTPAICSGFFTNIQLSSSVAGTTFAWTASPSSPNVTGYSNPGNGNVISDLLANSGLTVETVTYTITPTYNGCSNPVPGTTVVTVNPLPVPTVTGPSVACLNTTGIYTTEAGKSNYTWSVSPGGILVSGQGTNTATISWPVLGNQTVFINYTDANGCTAVSPVSYNVNVINLPVPALNGLSSICTGSSATYTTDAGMSNYSWTVSVGGTITAGGGVNDNTVTVFWPVVGPQTVSVNYFAGTGCTASNPTVLNITVNPLPLPTLAGMAVLCAGTSGVVYTTEPGMSGYTWTVSAGGTITAGGGPASNTVTVTWNAPGAQSVSVNYTNSNGCTALAPVVQPVTVNPLPAPTITGPASVCLNSTTAYSTEAGKINYSWTVSAGGSITGGAGTSNITILWSTTGAKTITVNYFDANGCTAASPVVYNVTVNVLPVPALAGSISICSGFSATYTTDAGMTNYSWTVSAGGTITAGGGVNNNFVTVLWSAAGPQSVSVNYTAATGCTASAPTVLNVTVHALPVPAIAGSAVLCAGTGGVTYTTQPAMSNYIWTVSAGGTVTAGGTASDNSVTVTWNTAGAQSVSVNYTNSNGCTALAPTVFPVTVNPLPVPTISGPAAVCLNSTTAYFTEAGKSNYSWIVSAGGTITGGAGTASITILWSTTGAKTVTVNYLDANGCTATVPASFAVNVSTLPVPSLIGLNTVCSGNPAVYNTDPGMTNYSWTISAGGAITAGGGPNDATATVLWSGVGNQTISVNYFAGSGCTAPSPTVLNVNVKPRPAITNAANSSICSGGSVSIPILASLPGCTFSWIATGSSPNVTGYHSGSGPVISDILANSGFNTETVTYAVTPSLNGCDGLVANFVVTVYPVANVTFNPNGQVICSAVTTSVSLLSGVAGATFTWTASGSSPNVTGFGPGSGASIAQTLTNLSFNVETVTYHVTPSVSGCPGTPGDVVVTVNPKPDVTLPLCIDPVTTTVAKPIRLRGGIPLGGTYSGTGVNAGIFYPGLAGPGNHAILYSYTNMYTCQANASISVNVLSPVPFFCNNTLTDVRDNKQYGTVQIGAQCWMADNLDYGNIIPSSAMQRDNCIVERYCFNDNPANCTTRGSLYQWDELMQFDNTAGIQGLCPPGWHVPTENEWNTLFAQYISSGFAGAPLKSTGYSGFNAFLYGSRLVDKSWNFDSFATILWSSSAIGSYKAWAHGMNTYNPSVSYYPGYRDNAFSVRCLKD